MNSRIKFAASSIVLGASLVGCKPAINLYRPVSASAAEAQTNRRAADHYQDAQIALKKGKLDDALAAMERAVEYSPRDAGFRMGLAELYMKSGRFVSAETTLADVLVLNPGDARAGIALALAQLGQGRSAAALLQLHSLEGSVNPSDLGLAYALAGNSHRAIELLEPAARAHDANARIRQNLALAYALAGDWAKARITASQDVSPAQLNSRMAQWAALADPSAAGTRVASILGVKPVEDAGQPARLALVPAAPPAVLARAELPAPVAPAFEQNEQAIYAEPVETAAYVPAAPLSVANAAAPVFLAGEAAPAEIAQVGPEPIAPETAEQIQFAQAAETLVRSPVAAPQASDSNLESIRAHVAARYDVPQLSSRPRTSHRGRYVVQLGAFSTPGNVEKAWARAINRYGALLAEEPLSTTIKVGGSKTLYRLSMAGYATQGDALRACRSIRGRGGACFVRSIAGDAPVQWASRYTRNS